MSELMSLKSVRQIFISDFSFGSLGKWPPPSFRFQHCHVADIVCLVLEMAGIASLLALSSDCSARGVGFSDLVKVLSGVKTLAVGAEFGEFGMSALVF